MDWDQIVLSTVVLFWVIGHYFILKRLDLMQDHLKILSERLHKVPVVRLLARKNKNKDDN